jgi:hypothetical protein
MASKPPLLTGVAARIARLRAGESISFSGAGNSMVPRIRSGDTCTYVPVLSDDDVDVGDMVFCHVAGMYTTHLVTAKHAPAGAATFQISNNHGHVNGTVTRASVFGRVVAVEGRPVRRRGGGGSGGAALAPPRAAADPQKTAPRAARRVITMDDPWFRLARDGVKQYEVRRVTATPYAVGDEVQVVHHTDPRRAPFVAAVTEVLPFPDVAAALAVVPLGLVVPGMHDAGAAAAECGRGGGAAPRGVVALRLHVRARSPPSGRVGGQLEAV